jgi:hypothetical protein
MTNFVEVDRDVFFKRMNSIDAVTRIVPGPFPYTTMFELRNRTVLGKIVGYFPEDSRLESKKYFLIQNGQH